MAIQFDPVTAGDLITADLMNRLLDAVEALDARLTKVEQGNAPSGRPIIDAVTPMTPRISDTVTLTGKNFATPGERTVSIDGVLVASTGNDSTLSFTVPNLDQVTSSGKRVTIIVNNLAGPTTTEVMVFPFVATKPQGDIWVSLKEAPTGSLAAGDHVFVYEVRAQVNLEETYNVTASSDAGWEVRIVDGGGLPISNPTLTLASSPPPGVSEEVRVRVSIPATGGASSKLLVRVEAAHNNQLTASNGGGETVTRGAAAPPPQVGMQLSCTTMLIPFGMPNAGTTIPVDGPATIAVSTNYWRLNFVGTFDHAGKYTATLTPIADAHWTQTLALSGTTPTLSKEYTVNSDGGSAPIYVFVKATSGAPPTDVKLTVTKSDNASITGQYTQQVHI